MTPSGNICLHLASLVTRIGQFSNRFYEDLKRIYKLKLT